MGTIPDGKFNADTDKIFKSRQMPTGGSSLPSLASAESAPPTCAFWVPRARSRTCASAQKSDSAHSAKGSLPSTCLAQPPPSTNPPGSRHHHQTAQSGEPRVPQKGLCPLQGLLQNCQQVPSRRQGSPGSRTMVVHLLSRWIRLSNTFPPRELSWLLHWYFLISG